MVHFYFLDFISYFLTVGERPVSWTKPASHQNIFSQPSPAKPAFGMCNFLIISPICAKFRRSLLMFELLFYFTVYIYEPVTKGRDLKWDTLPQNQTPSKLFSVLPLESGMFQVTISIIKKWFWSKCVLYGIKTGVRSGVDVCNNGHSECHNNTEKNHLYAILMLLVHLSSC